MSDFNSLLSSFDAASAPTEDTEFPAQPPLPDYSRDKMGKACEWTTNTFQLRQSMTAPTSSSWGADKPCTLAVCCVIVDKFPTESIWREWKDDGAEPPSSTSPENPEENHRRHVKYHIHAARPSSVTSPWVKSHLLPFTFEPKWNDFRIVRAVLDCVPLVSFDKLYSDLLKINAPTDKVPTPFKSYMTLSQPSKFDSESIWTKLNLNGFTSDKLIKKALPGWTVLGRDDVLGVLQTESMCYDQHKLNLWQAWENVWAPEEVYFPTMVNMFSSMRNVENRTVNFAQWDEHNRDHSKRANPLWFDGQFTVDLVRRWRRGGSLFGRKFRELQGGEWRRVVDIVDEQEFGGEKKAPASKEINT
ncbi:hypothetical protein TrRE_jg3722 [Triparma retinervis]|uniref:Uncharacterized protein n=1 Tax=Triparma retinervis TaxID=2557542 RepID=A0A9W7AMF9_9STRA|nr:hypothetical protein TrRE_jg3722 [Triparma retinervis]